MKKLILLLLTCSFALLATAQHATPRIPYSLGNATVQTLKVHSEYLSDAAGNDTTYISPDAHINQYWINHGDTLLGSHTVAQGDATFKAVPYTDNNIYEGDQLLIYTKTSGLLNDTIYYVGNFVCDTTGSGSSSKIIITKDLTKLSHVTKFIWLDGKWIHDRNYK